MNSMKFITYKSLLVLLTVGVYNAYAEERKIVVIIPSYNNAEWYERNLDSVFSQNYTNFRIVYVEDCWTVGSGLVQEYKDKHDTDNRMTLICNSERRGAMANIYDAVHSCDDNEIMVVIDGDDWLPNNEVLSTINRYYEDRNVWLTYGSLEAEPKDNRAYSRPIPHHIITQNKYRQHRWEGWQLRTFYAWLFKKVKKEDFMYEGTFFATNYDMAFMFPMFELSGGRFKMITEIIYVYNRLNEINDYKVNRDQQIKLERHIRALPHYEPLAPVYLHSIDGISKLGRSRQRLAQIPSLAEIKKEKRLMVGKKA